MDDLLYWSAHPPRRHLLLEFLPSKSLALPNKRILTDGHDFPSPNSCGTEAFPSTSGRFSDSKSCESSKSS
eukprot:754970-Hanusia_phi.AAC.3